MQFVIGGNPVESLNDVQATEIGLDGNLLAARELACHRQLAAEEGCACMHVPVDFLGNRRETFEVLRIRGNDDVHVPCSANDSPRSKRKAANDDELNLCLGKATKDLIESRDVQLCRAAPAI